MASQRHKMIVNYYGAECTAISEKQPSASYLRQIPGPYTLPRGAPGGPLAGSSLTGPPPAAIPAPQFEHPLLALGLLLSGGGPFVPPEPPDPELAPAADRLVPDEAVIGGPDITLTVPGVRFVEGAVIVFNGGDEPTTFVSDTELTTTVKPSTASTPGTYPVVVRNPDGQLSNELGFTFIEEAPVVRKPTRRRT